MKHEDLISVLAAEVRRRHRPRRPLLWTMGKVLEKAIDGMDLDQIFALRNSGRDYVARMGPLEDVGVDDAGLMMTAFLVLSREQLADLWADQTRVARGEVPR